MDKKWSTVIIMTLLLVLSGCNKSTDLKKVTLVLDYVPNTNHSGLYLAKDLGYYKDAGLDVEFMQPSQNAAEAVVASKQAEFAISSAEAVAQFDDENNQLVSIMGLLAHNTSGFISQAQKNITRPKDMEGKTYCGWGSDVERAIVKTMVANDGGNPEKVKITTTTGADIKNENSPCDVMWVFEGWDRVDMDNSGIKTNYIPFTDYDLDWYTPVLLTSRDLIKNNPDMIQSFVTASIKGYEQAIKDPNLAAKTLLKYAPELDEQLVSDSQEFLSANYKDDDYDYGYQVDKMWSDFGKWLKENKIISNDLDISSLYTNQFIKEQND